MNSATSYVTALGYDTGAVGNTWHAVVNGVYLLPYTSFWDTGSLVAEMAYSRLDKITKNEELYRGEGYAACVNVNEDMSDGCSTDNFFADST